MRQPSSSPTTADVLRNYFAIVYLAAFGTLAMLWHFGSADTLPVTAYMVGITAAYTALYLLVPVLLTGLVAGLMALFRAGPAARRRAAYLSAWLGGTLLLLGLYADYRIYTLYEYHLNGFVWNLLTTPGGIAALGATTSTQIWIGAQVGLLCAASAGALWALQRYQRSASLFSSRTLVAFGGLMVLALASGEAVYAYSTHTGQEDYLQATEVVPFHFNTSATRTLNKWGIKREAMTTLRVASGQVDYPGQQLEAKPLAKYPNVIMLVAESFRWDLLDPEVTPNLWKFSEKALRFENHYSGGNRTRMGLFSMFYGLYSPYWYSFEQQRIAPALMNFIRQKNYQLALHTSQSFDYPELRHTVFTGVDEKYMQEIKTGEPWQRDIRNISDIIGKLDQRDPARPFYGFMFFESTHAPYTFPAEAVIRPDYEEDLNYVRMNLQDNISRIHARYVNAAHHVDHEVGRLLDHLRKTGMLDNTIVLFTGDHGEEFMEKGHWGHGHSKSFPEEQIRVPLVLWMPGQKPQAVTYRTSHLQISPTLLERLGVTQDSLSYSSSTNLFTQRPYFVAGDYNYMAVFDERNKVTFPFSGSDFFRYIVHDQKDFPVSREDRKTVVTAYKQRIDEVVSESMRFVK